jgi:hypothetical protein
VAVRRLTGREAMAWHGYCCAMDTPTKMRRSAMSLSLILLIVLVLLLIGAVPSWPYSRSWGYGPSGGLGILLVIVIILFLVGVL